MAKRDKEKARTNFLESPTSRKQVIEIKATSMKFQARHVRPHLV